MRGTRRRGGATSTACVLLFPLCWDMMLRSCHDIDTVSTILIMLITVQLPVRGCHWAVIFTDGQPRRLPRSGDAFSGSMKDDVPDEEDLCSYLCDRIQEIAKTSLTRDTVEVPGHSLDRANSIPKATVHTHQYTLVI